MERLSTPDDVAAASGNDAFACWTAQRLGAGGAAYTYGHAVAVVSPALFHRDRLVLRGAADDAIELIRHLGPTLPDTYRVVAGAPVIRAGTSAIPELEQIGEFVWMQTSTLAPDSPSSVGWLARDDLPGAAELMARANPGSWAIPGESPEHRWAGCRDEDGRLVALAADAWTGGGVGFVAGVVTDPQARRSGYGRATTAFVTNELVRAHGRSALGVERDNQPAISLYRRLGYTGETIAVARISG